MEQPCTWRKTLQADKSSTAETLPKADCAAHVKRSRGWLWLAWTTLACLIPDKINGWKIQLDFKAKSEILKPDLYKAIIAANNISMPNTDTYL